MKRCFAVVFVATMLAFLLGGCSTLDSLNPFASNSPKMAELKPIQPTADARVVWRESVGQSALYAFAPAVVRCV